MGVRVLLVEDSRQVQQALGDVLEVVGGYELLGICDDARSTLRWLAEHPYGCDLVICDLELREGSGTQVLHALAGAAQPAVVVFSEAQAACRARSLPLPRAPRFCKSRFADFIDWLERYPGQMALPLAFDPPVGPRQAPQRRARRQRARRAAPVASGASSLPLAL